MVIIVLILFIDLLNNQLLFTQKTATEINKITKSTSQTFDIELFGSVNI